VPIRLSEIHFRVLGVTRLSTKEEIRKAFIREIKKWHPDKFPNDPEKAAEALERSKLINQAFELLKEYVPKIVSKNSSQNETHSKSTKSTEAPKRTRVEVQRFKVRSSNVVSVGYHKLLKILQVEYRGGTLYQYYNVPESVFIHLMKVESIGRFMNKNINFRYPYRAV
jgi:hypothetical protein